MSTTDTEPDVSDKKSHAIRFFNQEAKNILGQREYHNLRHGAMNTSLVADEAVENFILEGASKEIQRKAETGWNYRSAFRKVTRDWPLPAVGRLAEHELYRHSKSGDDEYSEMLRNIEAEHNVL